MKNHPDNLKQFSINVENINTALSKNKNILLYCDIGVGVSSILTQSIKKYNKTLVDLRCSMLDPHDFMVINGTLNIFNVKNFPSIENPDYVVMADIDTLPKLKQEALYDEIKTRYSNATYIIIATDYPGFVVSSDIMKDFSEIIQIKKP